ncbi:hypothetical protein TNCV_4408711 [Trichonephila clavipes]|nr:hypothetical protein TNCV_4408711 [Trichonephila clavipes]
MPRLESLRERENDVSYEKLLKINGTKYSTFLEAARPAGEQSEFACPPIKAVQSQALIAARIKGVISQALKRVYLLQAGAHASAPVGTNRNNPSDFRLNALVIFQGQQRPLSSSEVLVRFAKSSRGAYVYKGRELHSQHRKMRTSGITKHKHVDRGEN